MKAGVDYIGVNVVFFCHDGQGNWLLHKRSQNCRDEQGHWDCGGGQLEFGEDIEDGLLREVAEEYGCKGVISAELPIHNALRQHNGKKTHWVSIGFIVQVDPSEAKLNEPHSMDEIGWFTFANLPEPLHTSAQKRLLKHKKHFAPFL